MPTPTHQSHSPRRARIAAAASLAVLLSCAAVSACGGSSHPASATGAAATAQTTVTHTVASAAASVVASAQTAHAAGATSPGSGSGATAPTAGANANTNGAGAAHENESAPQGSSHNGAVSSKFPPAFVAAVRAFAACVRSHGVKISEPNLSGHGEIFQKSSINPNDPNYRAALKGCEGDLINILRAAGAAHIGGVR